MLNNRTALLWWTKMPPPHPEHIPASSPTPTSAFKLVPFSGDGLNVDPKPGAWECLPFLKDQMFIGIQLCFLKRHLTVPLRNMLM